ncbi:MAG: hypothetical protein HY722_17245 [Planctomycetes bacterium]|nr:hypothetical protein [Planctomycetota bacterium]
MSETGRVIKRSETADQAAHAGAFSLLDYQEEGRRIIGLARRKAAMLIAEARRVEQEAARSRAQLDTERARLQQEMAQAERIKGEVRLQGLEEGRVEGREMGVEEGRAAGFEAARKEGFQAAHDEARKALQEETRDVARTLEAVLSVVEEERERVIKTAHANLIRLAVAVAGKVIKREVALDPDVIKGNVIRAVDLAMQEAVVTIQVNPTDQAVIGKYLDQVRDQFAKIKAFEVETDPAIAQGGCVVKSGDGVVDMRLETQLAEIERQLLEG